MTTLDADLGDAETEQMARRLGWKPKEEFRGNPDEWSNAQTFIDNGMAALPILRQNIKKMNDKLTRSESEVGMMRAQISEIAPIITELRDRGVNADRAGYERAMTEIEARKREAVDTADSAAYDRAEGQRKELEKHQPPPAAATPATGTNGATPPNNPFANNPELAYVDRWIKSDERNWYRNDPDLQAQLDATHASLRRTKPALTIEENLIEAEQKVRKLNPEKFGEPVVREPVQPKTPSVETPNPPIAPRQGDRTLANLPPEAKAAFYRFKAAIDKVNPGKPYTEAEYLKTYQWDN